MNADERRRGRWKADGETGKVEGKFQHLRQKSDGEGFIRGSALKKVSLPLHEAKIQRNVFLSALFPICVDQRSSAVKISASASVN
jgi:hypothetical protein